MSTAESELLLRLKETIDLMVQGALHDARESLLRIEATNEAPRSELVAALSFLIARFGESYASKESALANVQLSMLELENIQEELRLKEARYHQLVSNMNDAIVVYAAVDGGKDLVVRDINDASVRLERVSREAVLGRRVMEVFPGAAGIDLLEVLRRVHSSGVAEHLPARFYRDERASGWREYSIYQLTSEEVVAVYRDVSERCRAESLLQQERILLRTVIDQLPDGIYAKDANCQKLLANLADAQFLGYDSVAEVLGKSDFELLPRQDAIATILEDQSVISTGEPILNREESFINRRGRRVWLQTSKLPLRNESGEIVGLVGIGHDIAARKQAEAERAQMEIQLRQAQKLESIGHLAAGIAHEINTPIQFIGDNTRFLLSSFGDLLKVMTELQLFLASARDPGLPPIPLAGIEAAIEAADVNYLVDEIPKAIAQSLEGVARVTQIVRAMKEFSHPSGAEKVRADLNKGIESSITVCRNEWKYVAEMVTDLDPHLPLVPCHLSEFNQVILNLVINAAHAIAGVVSDGGTGKGTITVTSRRDGEWVEVRVRDTGAGIPESVRDRIFTPFFTTKEVGKGTGQGLAIAHSVITDKHGGTIRFETETGKGTTFILRLPLVPPAIAKTTPQKAERLGGAPGSQGIPSISPVPGTLQP